MNLQNDQQGFLSSGCLTGCALFVEKLSINGLKINKNMVVQGGTICDCQSCICVILSRFLDIMCLQGKV